MSGQMLQLVMLKAASGNFLYANEEVLNKRDLRYAEWNWCNIREGKKAEDLIIEHKTS